MTSINLSHNKSPGSLILKGNNTIQSVEGDGIRNYRWVDGQHDFEPKFPANNINTHLRSQYKIGKGVFIKEGAITSKADTNTNTNAGRNSLHKVLDFERIFSSDSKIPITVTFPDANISSDSTFTHTFPTVHGDVKLENIGTTTIDTQVGDILVNIIGHKEKFMEKAAEVKKFLGIGTTTYSKDAANLSTDTFRTIFQNDNGELGIDFSYFSEVLDPASEQTDMNPANVNLTLLYCYINGSPVYISLKKKGSGSGVHSKQNRTWYYAFHINKDDVIPESKYTTVDFGVTTSGAHPAPNIDTAAVFIKKNIENKQMAAALSKAVSVANRLKNKAKATVFGKDKLTKKEAQNVKNFGQFDDFYLNLVSNFYAHTGLTNNAENSKTVILSFKTIGDQMYLYDAILLSKLVADNIDQSWVITTDTFLRDYVIYTKSANVISVTKPGKTPGMRKIAVYLKPRKALTEEQLRTREAALSAKAAKEEADYINETSTNMSKIPVLPEEIVPRNDISLLINNIDGAIPVVDTRRNDKFTVEGSSDIDGFHIILLYYAILTYKMAIVESNILKEVIDIELFALNTFFIEFNQNKTIEMKETLTVEQQKLYIASIESNIYAYEIMKQFIEAGNNANDWKGFTTAIVNLLVKNAFDKLSDKKYNSIIASVIVNNMNQIFKRGPTQYIKEFSFFMSERKTIEYNLTKLIGYQSGGDSESGAYLSDSQLGEYYYKELQKEIEGLIGSEPVQSEVNVIPMVDDDIDVAVPMVDDDIIGPVAKSEDKTMEAKFIEFVEQKLDAEEEIDTKETTTEPVPPTVFNIPTDESDDMKIDIDNINIDDDLYHISILYNRFLEMSDKDFDDYALSEPIMEVEKNIVTGKRKLENIPIVDDDDDIVKKPKNVFNFGQRSDIIEPKTKKLEQPNTVFNVPMIPAGGKKKNKCKTLKKRKKTKNISSKKNRKTQRYQIKKKRQTKKAKKSKN